MRAKNRKKYMNEILYALSNFYIHDYIYQYRSISLLLNEIELEHVTFFFADNGSDCTVYRSDILGGAG